MSTRRREEEEGRLLSVYVPPDISHDNNASFLMFGHPWLPTILPDNLGDPGRRHLAGLFADAP